MHKLVLLRHGESQWNLENRFTGWTDVDLTDRGIVEAESSGKILKSENFQFDLVYTSVLTRAIRTMEICLKAMDIHDIPIEYDWRLNERHYGALTGLNKDEMKKTLGEDKVLEFRRSWNVRPEPLNRNNPYHPINIEIYKNIPKDKIPDTESLKDTYERVIPYFEKNILDKLNKNIIIAAHGNSIRALCKYLFNIDNEKISKLEIPTGNPLLIKFDNNKKVKEASYLDKKRANDLIIFN